MGGCVRDYLLGVPPKDYDIVTNVAIDKLEQVFQGVGWRTTEAGKAFMVLNISKNHYQFEIANFRKEACYDGRRPQIVDVGTMQEDAERRDFTVNALYQDPWTGIIQDPTKQGKKDLADRILRFIGDPKKRIMEDRLRIFRFYRFNYINCLCY